MVTPVSGLLENLRRADAGVPTSAAHAPGLDALRALGVDAPVCRRVLVVDDELENLMVIEAMLEDEHEVHTAESAAEALALHDRLGGFDLVLADQRMPGMTGVELLAEIAARAPETVRIVLTAFADEGPIIDAVNRGQVYRFLLKPWEADELLAAVRDGLELKSARAALARTVRALACRKSALTRLLDELESARAQVLPAERRSTLGRLSSGIIHDLRNQLGGLTCLVAAVEQESVEPPVLSAARDAVGSLESLAGLLDEIHDYARAPRATAARSPIETRLFIDEAVHLLHLELGSGRDAIDAQIDPGAERLFVAADRLRQGLLALLRNALRASPLGAPVIVQVTPRPWGQVTVSVRDRGHGMDASTLARAPEPFFSAFDPPGLGLGLEIARIVAEDHHGFLELDSRPGEGTLAALWLAGALSAEELR